jgi:hypothetical protein
MLSHKLPQGLPANSDPPCGRGLRAMCAILVVMGVAHLVGAGRAIVYGSGYATMGVRFPPLLAALAGIGWGLALIWLGRQLWLGRNRSARVVFLVLGLYALSHLVGWRVFSGSDYALARWPFAALLMAVWIGGLVWVSALFSRSRISQ